MVEKSGYVIILESIIILILIIMVGVLSYIIYYNLPGEPVKLPLKIANNSQEIILPIGEVDQFYLNMKFNHNNITYQIDNFCTEEEKNNVILAFQILSSNVKIIEFFETNKNPDISVICSETEKNSVDSDHFIAGEGGAKEIVKTGKFSVITNGIILLYENKNKKKCDWPNVELHELIHVFGFNHSSDKNSLMYPYLESCTQTLDSSIIDKLHELYSLNNLPDLYFENAEVIKKGRYLDVNITIKNSGTIDSEIVNFSIFDDKGLVEVNTIKQISYGAGINIEIQNLKLNNRNPKFIQLIIDSENKIIELDEENNKVIIEIE